MRLGLLLVFAAIPFLEIALMIKVGQAIGFWPTLALFALSAMLGLFVLYEQGFQVMARAMEALGRGRTPMGAVVDGMFVLFAGMLLIVPGFLTDAVGLSLLVPAIRRRVAAFSVRRMLRSAEMRGFVFGNARTAQRQGPRSTNGGTPHTSASDGPIIEGEFHHVGDRTMDKRAGDTKQSPRRDG